MEHLCPLPASIFLSKPHVHAPVKVPGTKTQPQFGSALWVRVWNRSESLLGNSSPVCPAVSGLALAAKRVGLFFGEWETPEFGAGKGCTLYFRVSQWEIVRRLLALSPHTLSSGLKVGLLGLQRLPALLTPLSPHIPPLPFFFFPFHPYLSPSCPEQISPCPAL